MTNKIKTQIIKTKKTVLIEELLIDQFGNEFVLNTKSQIIVY